MCAQFQYLAHNFNIKYIYFNIEISFNIYDFFLSSLNT